LSPTRKRKAVAEVRSALGVSERRACQVLEQPRSTQRYAPREDEEEQRLIARMLELVREHPRYGYRFVAVLLRREGWRVNRKRVYRLWVQEGLQVPRKQRKKRRLGTSENGCVRRRAEHKNHVWAWDFVFDRTANGRSIKWLSIVDEYTRECVALEVDRRMTSDDVLDVLRDLFVIRGVPKHIRSDNGPEFIARAIREFLAAADVETLYIEPGSPWQNGYAESFHSRLRSELLDAEVFDNVAAAQGLAASWRCDYNHHRPHSSLGYQTPAEYAAACAASAPAAPALQQHTRKEEDHPLPLPQPTLS
jgi:transposase InsO family protein